MAPVLSFPRRAENQEGQPIGKGKSGEGKPAAWGAHGFEQPDPPTEPPVVPAGDEQACRANPPPVINQPDLSRARPVLSEQICP